MKNYATYVGDLESACEILDRTIESMGLSPDRPEEARDRGMIYLYPNDNREDVYVDGEYVATLKYTYDDAGRWLLHYRIED